MLANKITPHKIERFGHYLTANGKNSKEKPFSLQTTFIIRLYDSDKAKVQMKKILICTF